MIIEEEWRIKEGGGKLIRKDDNGSGVLNNLSKSITMVTKRLFIEQQ